MEFLYNYIVHFTKNGKVVDSKYCQTIEQVRTLQAVGRSRGCNVEYYCFNTDMKKESKVEEQKKKKTAKKDRTGWGKCVMCVETKVVYDTISDCARATGLSFRTLYNALNSGTARNGYHYQYTGKTKVLYVPTPKRRRKSVRCINDGKVYDSITDCGKAYGINSGFISLSIKRGKTAKGLRFELVEG